LTNQHATIKYVQEPMQLCYDHVHWEMVGHPANQYIKDDVPFLKTSLMTPSTKTGLNNAQGHSTVS
jgi:hypothetical protein